MGMKASPCRTCALNPTGTRWKTTFGGSLQGTERSSAIGGVLRVESQYDCMNPNRVLVIHVFKDRREATVFHAHAPAWSMCENLVKALQAHGKPAEIW